MVQLAQLAHTAHTATEPQLALKVTPPRIAKTVLERARLASTRPEWADKAVILLQTPSGSGKTSLLAQWRKEALQAGALVVWLTLDARDSSGRLVRALTAGMRSASGRSNFGVASLLAAESVPDSLEPLTTWLAAVAALAVDTLLILDDVHALPDETLNGSLVYLLLNAPANLRIVLASRKPLDLPMAELPARGSFAALSAADLRFDQAETVAVLKARFGARIDADSCVRLHELTEGWPLGVQLAVSSIERAIDLRAAIAAFSVQASDVERYFVDCLVKQLPVELADALVCMASVDLISPSLCAALLQCDEAAAADLLRQLSELTPIFSAGVNSQWLRLHPMARSFLRERFEQWPAARQQEIHARAGQWASDNHMDEPAARHLLAAGDTERAYALIESSLYELLLTGQVVRVTEWLERLPRSEIEQRVRLRITLAWVLAQSERHAEALALMTPLLGDDSLAPADQLECREVCAMAALFADDIELESRMVASWQASERPAVPTLELIGISHAALLTLYRGAPDEARYAYRQFSGDDANIGRYALGWRDWVIGYSYMWEGYVKITVDKLTIALAAAEADSGRRSPISVTLAAALAMAQLECNQPEAAAALLADRLDVIERCAPPTAIAMGFVTAIRVASITHDEQRAFELLDYLWALGEARKLPRLCVIALGERIRLHALRGRGDICAVVERKLTDLLAGAPMQPLGILQPIADLQRGLAYAYAAVARQDWKRVLEILDPLPPVAERMRRGREALQIFLLRALARKRCGEDGTPLLLEAISMARVWGFARVLIDTHPDLADWAQKLQSAAEPGAGMREKTLATASTAPDRTASAPVVRVANSSLLSPKEREVLQLLAGNMSNKEIARAMGVSDETVKWHLKNLFSKLNAGTRKHLLDRARMMGILVTPG